ncbi:MAG: nicotinamide mononucleotide transporter [Sphingobacteriaceae bacterium]|nr:nicotinamide mononucleotide transporter [Sphingobacteriaceae bacterium]
MILLDAAFWQPIVEQLKQTSWLEWLGTITGFACVYLAAKQHILNWPVSIVSIIASAVVYYNSKLYGDAVLQGYFLFTAVYGWYYWIKRKQEDEKPIVSLNKTEFALAIGSIAVLSILLGLFLDHFTPTNVPYADGFCTAMSFVAQYLMTRKVLQNWILWIVVDICYVPLLVYKELMSFALLYMLFVALAIIGYIDWKKTWKAATV